MRLDDPLLVRWEYASEERLAKRNARPAGADRRRAPGGCGLRRRSPRRSRGGCSTSAAGRASSRERLADELGADVQAVDRLAAHGRAARARSGSRPRSARSRASRSATGSSTASSRAGCFYHRPMRRGRSRRCARVLKPGGRLVAATVCGDNSPSCGCSSPIHSRGHRSRSTARTGADLLRRSFGHVERRDVTASMVFPDAERMRTFVSSTIDRAHLAPQVPELTEPFRATTRHAVFVAERPT